METFRQLGLPVDEAYSGVKLSAQIFIISMGVFGNIYTIYCVVAKSKLQKVTNIFIVTISLALILQVLNAYIDFQNHWDTRGENFVWEPMICRAWQTANVYLPSMLSLLCFFAILDRYLVLEHPAIYNKVMNSLSAAAMLAITFVYPAIVSIPPIYLDWHTDDPSLPRGECKFKITLKYALLSPLVTFWLPMLLVIVAIVKLFRAMERHDSALGILMMVRGPGLTKAAEVAREKAAASLPWGEDQIRRQHRLAITLWSVYWNICIFWIPQHVWQVIYKITDANWPRATNFMPWFGYMPSAILPGLLLYYDIYDI